MNSIEQKAISVIGEPEFRPGGFVWNHIVKNKSDPMVAVRSAVDRMRELHDIEDHEFSTVCVRVLTATLEKINRSKQQ